MSVHGMDGLLGIFASAILPVVAIAAVGFVLGRLKDVDARGLNTVTVYVLAPALVFHSLAVSELSGGTVARVAVGVVAFTSLMVLIGEFVGRLAGESDAMVSALVLVAAFSNSGNLGIPVSDLAFGEVGRQTAVLFLSVQAVLMYTLGVYAAARAGGTGGFAGFERMFRIPLVYAVAAALGVALALGFEDPTVARTFVIECAMPAAVTPVILTVEFAASGRVGGLTVPEYVSTCVLATTLLSTPLLTGLIALLQSGVLI